MKQATIVVTVLCVALWGCNLRKQEPCTVTETPSLEHYRDCAAQLEYAASCPCDADCCTGIEAPSAIGYEDQVVYYDLRLEEATQLALQHSRVMRDLSGAVLRAPATVRTSQAPALTDTDPRFGTDAALSAFDATFRYSAYWEKNDRALNNTFFGGGTRSLQQDLGVYQAQLSKRSAVGTQMALRHYTDYDANNAPGNAFRHAWQVWVEGEVRQPLLQGGWLDYNRIVGPNGQPGLYSGVLLARVNNDISLADFELGIRDLVSNVENAYWDLYLAYRYLHASIRDRDRALEYWRNINAQYKAGREGVDAALEAAARERYFQFEEEVRNAWSGRLLEGTRTYNGSAGGTLRSATTIRGADGVRVAERRLRLLIGLSIADGRLLRPADEPQLCRMMFDWEQSIQEACTRRAELRRQRWTIKRRELELVGSKNFLLPQFDAVGRYRFRGLGRNLLDPNPNVPAFDNAYKNLTTGDFQEWQLGLEFSYPLGNRKGHVTVRNAELQLSRERALLREQEREVIHDLSNNIAEVDRSYDVASMAYNRREAARDRVLAEQANYDTGVERQPDKLLEAQRQLNEIEARFYIALVEYMLAVKNVHFEKGTLLDYNQISLAEGPWPEKAYRDAAERRRFSWTPERLNYVLHPREVLTNGPVPQGTLPAVEFAPEAVPPGPPVHQAPPPRNLPLPDTGNEGPLERLPGESTDAELPALHESGEEMPFDENAPPMPDAEETPADPEDALLPGGEEPVNYEAPLPDGLLEPAPTPRRLPGE